MESERRGDPEGCSGEGDGVREGGSGRCSPASRSSFSGYRPCGQARNLGSGWMSALLSGLRDRTRRGRRHPVPSGLFSAPRRGAGQTGCWAWQPRGPAGAGSRSSSSGLSGPLPASSVCLLPFLGPKRTGSCRELRLPRCSWRAARLGLSGPPCSGPARRAADWGRKGALRGPDLLCPLSTGRASLHDKASLRLEQLRAEDQGWYECKVLLLDQQYDTFHNGSWVHLTIHGACVRARGPVRGACVRVSGQTCMVRACVSVRAGV